MFQKYGFASSRHGMTAGAADWLCVARLLPALSEANTTPAIDVIILVDTWRNITMSSGGV